MADARVKITTTKLIPYSLPLHHGWQSHSNSFLTRQGYLLQIEDERGYIGYGDCAPLPSQGTETVASAIETIERQLPRLIGVTATDAQNSLSEMKSTPAARCAMETALLDLVSKQQATPLHRWLNPDSSPKVLANANIGALDHGIDERITTALRQGYSILKLKVGVYELKHELELLKQICSDLSPEIMLRLDANRAWDRAVAEDFISQIKQLPIESLEEPLAKPEIETLKQLQDETDIAIALDETVAELELESLQQLQPLRRIILKPMALGGVLPAWHIGQLAHSQGIDTVVTTTIDSAAGVWAATQLAATLDPKSKYHHGVATSDWLLQDIGAGPEIENGIITIPQTPGLGFTPYD
jgi:o-succinylbenzoate synthase